MYTVYINSIYAFTEKRPEGSLNYMILNIFNKLSTISTRATAAGQGGTEQAIRSGGAQERP